MKNSTFLKFGKKKFDYRKLLGEDASDITLRLKKLKKKVYNLGVGDPDFRIPNRYLSTFFSKIKKENITYTDPTGLPELKKLLCKKYPKLNLNEKNIAITQGGKIGIFYAFLLLGGKKKEILMPSLSFPSYFSLAKYNGSTIKKYDLKPSKNFKPLAEDIIKKISSKTKLIIINSPHNPTSSVMDDNEMVKLVKYLRNKEIYLLSDEIYSDLTFEKKKYYSFGQFKEIRKKLIIINGWSKNYGLTGWRIGWSYWPKIFVKHINMFCINISTSTNYLSQKLVINILKNDHLINEHREKLTIQRNYLLEKFKEKINFNFPEGGIYFFLKIPNNFKNDIIFSSFLLKKYGIATIPGSSFGSAGKKYVRVNYSKKRKDVEKFLKIYSSLL
tara:strand:+ start:7529 stop:8686 length:1158 start_codon:yes stop_codon:yes gene_type:complete